MHLHNDTPQSFTPVNQLPNQNTLILLFVTFDEAIHLKIFNYFQQIQTEGFDYLIYNLN